ncbi:hypothetical protein [Marimonas lutisalis]|uniref:hypothetical protein n=1 Tax=Marimonas lutisalis TaxID=2545756 RepID=UPI0010F44C34|nr:hypothetical protein [Marimonas lutisalis]
MGQQRQGAWGPWTRHDGNGMPVRPGTVVEVFSEEDPKTARNGVVKRVGIAGVDLVYYWHWTAETRATQSLLPIDLYREKRPRGLLQLEDLLVRPREPVEA